VEIEVIEAVFESRVLTCKVKVRAIDFRHKEQNALVELILRNTNALFVALDEVSDFEDSRMMTQAFEIVKKMAVTQHNTLLSVIEDEMAALVE